MGNENNLQNLVEEFLKIGVIKIGSFLLKSNVTSPIYVDLRTIISYPNLVRQISEKVWDVKKENNVEMDIICGVPYTALPLASALQIIYNIPMVLRRKEVKNYGTKKVIEGNFIKGQKCLIIEDVVTSGSSVLETTEILRKEGLVVTDCIVVVNREEGGAENLSRHGITLHSLFSLKNILSVISKIGTMPEKEVQQILEQKLPSCNVKNCKRMSLTKRAETCTNKVLTHLFHIVEQKQSNLCVAVDVTKSKKLLELAETVGPFICMLKTHIDILEDFNEEFPLEIKKIADKHNFLIMEDRKFADIGNTVKLQYTKGIYKIKDWADIVTVHSIPGEGVIKALKESSDNRACVLIAQMSSSGALTSESYATQTVEMAEKYKEYVIGFISQSSISGNSNFIHMCPGISLEQTNDNLGQQYKTPEVAVTKDGIDIVIVGRGIINAENIAETAKLYQENAYKAYSKAFLED